MNQSAQHVTRVKYYSVNLPFQGLAPVKVYGCERKYFSRDHSGSRQFRIHFPVDVGVMLGAPREWPSLLGWKQLHSETAAHVAQYNVHWAQALGM